MRAPLLLLSFVFAGMIRAEPGLDALLTDERLWKTTRAEFIEKHGALGFGWVSQARDAAVSTQPGLTLFRLPVYQATARFQDDTLRAVNVFFYNRGDAGELPKGKFEALLKSCVEALSTAAGSKPIVRGKDAASAVRAEGLTWSTPAANFLLEYSFTREVKTRDIPFRAEFVRLDVSPLEKPRGLIATNLAASRQPVKFSGRDHVKREPNGDVHITDVPMVDQGEKGYCVVASAERLMRYYGTDADAHELAQIANSSATAGTSNEAMFEALKKLSQRLRIKVREVEKFDYRTFVQLVEDYNRAARRENAPPIDIANQDINVAAIYSRMKPDVLRASRTKAKADMGRFRRSIETHIDGGIPLLWSVMLGMVPEAKGPQGMGGHMRLIIGYNAKTSELIFSDSWGLGHESKRMPLADAWTITTGLNAIEPL